MASPADGARPDHDPGSPAAPLPRELSGVETVLAQAATENFPVASRVLPGGVRRHLLALYGFFRLVDYAGDEAPGHRESLLDLLDADLKRVYHGAPRIPLLRALVPTVRSCAIPREVLVRLIDANRQDQRVSRYEKFDDLRDYCALSANPVGQSVLHVFGRAEPTLIELSDQICTALQVLEHCQDVGKDYQQGRIYLPAEDLRRFQCAEEDFQLRRAPTALRGLIRFEVDRALGMLDSGSALIGELSGMARVAVAGYVAGGRATARAFAAAGHDPLATEVRPGRGWTVAEWIRLYSTGGVR